MVDLWRKKAIKAIYAEMNRSAETHLLKIWFPKIPSIDLYIKDETTHATGSLKHRLARSLYLYGLCNGWINKDTPIIEASSGNTAVAEAYFSFLLGLKFTAIMPKTVSESKIKRIKKYSARCILIDGSKPDREVAAQLATESNGHFMDQFTFAERAIDWRGNNNIAESIFYQMKQERYPVPLWIVCGAGTGGTATTLGRYIHYSLHPTQLCVVDPEDSVLYDYYQNRDPTITLKTPSRIEGIGRSYVPSSFFPNVISRMLKIPDAGSIAALYFLENLTGLRFGVSTGTTLYGSFKLIAEMHQAQKNGSLVAIAGDNGHLYDQTYYNRVWLKKKNIDIEPYLEQLENFYATGIWVDIH